MYRGYEDYCANLKKSEKYRALSTDSNKLFLDFSSNDYLRLSHRNELKVAAMQAAEMYGMGATGSRLLSGNLPIFEKLESQIACDKKTEAALIYNSGYQANQTVLRSLLDSKVLGSKPIVFFDRLNHASLYQALHTTEIDLIRYRHNDFENLEKQLEAFRHDNRAKFIVTETLFGMDGDVLPIDKIVRLAKAHGAFLYLDEAHATGMLGQYGYGLSTQVALGDVPHVVMGTFSKALGCCGAYIACSEVIKNFLINKSAGFIYSTALSPMLIGAITKSWEMVKDFEIERKSFFLRADKLRNSIQNLGFDTGLSNSHIIPIILGDEKSAIGARNLLLQENIIVSAVRPPSIPPGSSRLRIALHLQHSEEEIERLLKGLAKL